MSEKSDRAGPYTAADIQVLSGLKAVRKRPGMYVGDVGDGSGLQNMLYEIVDNAVDGALVGLVTELTVRLNADGSATVRDNGVGLPTAVHPEEGVSTAELIMTRLWAGGGSDSSVGGMPRRQTLCSLAIVNALSAEVGLKTWREGREHYVRFRDGIADAPLEDAGPAGGKRGMEITFRPSPEVFRNVTDFDCAALEHRLRELAFLNAGLRVVLEDDRHNCRKLERMCYPGGAADFVRFLDRNKHHLIDAPITVTGDRNGVAVELALWWNETYAEQVLCFTNTLPQRGGGTHLAGFHAALARLVTRLADERGSAASEKVALTDDDLRRGLTAVLSIKMHDPQLSGCTRERLASPEVKAIVESIVGRQLAAWLDAHPKQTQAILAKAEKAAAARALSDFVRRPPAGHR